MTKSHIIAQPIYAVEKYKETGRIMHHFLCASVVASAPLSSSPLKVL